MVCIDFETFYSKDCTITAGLDNYLNHPEFDAYMVSFYSDTGRAWVGHPKDAPWEMLEGEVVVAHNRNFDQPVMEHLQEQGIVPPVNYKEFQCTADMSAYLGWGRSLKESLKNACGLLMKKDIRDSMKGKKFDEQDPEVQRSWGEYALYDSKGGLLLAQKGMSQWPDHEKRLSHETTRMCRAGLPVNSATLDDAVSKLSMVIEDAIIALPWADEQKGALSPNQFAEYCRSVGKEAPASTAKNNEDTLKWMQDNPEEARVLQSMHDLRGANALLKKVETIRGRVSNGRVPFGMKYFGAIPTGRDSGDSGFNVQNLPQGDLYGVNLRSAIEAPEGKSLLVADQSQIEPRCAAYLSGEHHLLEIAATGMDWYEVEARNFGMYDGPPGIAEHAPAIRKQMKTNALGCQYLMGPKGLAAAAGIPLSEAAPLVRQFRAGRPALMKLGKRLERTIRRAAMEGYDFNIDLPSGRRMVYFEPALRGGVTAEVCRNGMRTRLKYWPGMLIENATQAFARDVFMDRVLALVDAGFHIILRVHDEVVIEVDEKDAEEASKEIHKIMTTSPDWCPRLPLHTEVIRTQRYTK